MTELKPCPFCGHSLTWDGKWEEWYHAPISEGVPSKCVLAKHSILKSEEDAWNTRVDLKGENT